MKYFDFSSGARDEVFRFFIWGEGCSISIFSSGARDGAFRLLIEFHAFQCFHDWGHLSTPMKVYHVTCVLSPKLSFTPQVLSWPYFGEECAASICFKS